MSADREEAATGIAPEALAHQMKTATRRLREQGWKIAPLVNPVVDEHDHEQQSA